MRECTVYAPAKLNLYLDVLEKRPDGYHNIKTLFEKIDLRDEIILKEKAGGLRIVVEPADACPAGKGNIVYRAVQRLFKQAGVNLGLEIIIKKRIPVSAGLGGGSSDAATVLRSINQVFDLGMSVGQLFSIAVETGMDVPFFMLDTAFAIGRDRGESLEPVETDCFFSHIVIRPVISISTAQMYKRLDTYTQRPEGHGIEEMISALKKKDITLLKNTYYNIFEQVLADCSQHIDRAKALLLKAGAGSGFLSGSGPSVFCILKHREEAIELAGRIPKGQGMEVFVATTYGSFAKGGIYGDNRGQDIPQRRG